jgi:alpha-tubulin suppressor-like RCC1 family protein
MAGKHGCGVTFESELHCWGMDAPDVPDGPVLGVAAGGGDKEGETPFTCVIEPIERAVLCFLDGWSTPDRRLEGVLAITAGDTHVCAITAEKQVACWQPGGETSPQTILKSDQTPLSNVVQVAAGFERTCAADGDHTVWCWGRLDCKTTDSTPTAVKMIGVGADPGGIDFGRSHGCFQEDLSVTYCYGDSGSGQVVHCGGCIDTLLPVN